MKFKTFISIFLLITFFLQANFLLGQTTISGIIIDKNNNEPLIQATVLLKGSNKFTTTDIDGKFQLKVDQDFPFTIQVSYVSYKNQEIEITEAQNDLIIKLDNKFEGVVAEVTDDRILKKIKLSPKTIESMDILAIKNTASASFYDGLGVLPGVDLTKASLGFTIINTRGFNSTSPVRTLQIIDGVDNQAPGLNFSLGNFLGSSELDVLRVDLIVGASSAFYGPNAFNGVISMQTKNPFLHKGLSAIVKVGERNLFDAAIRYAESFRNKDSLEVFALKANFAYMQANDWEAINYEAVTGTRTDETNPGRWDAINIYGDEYQSINDGGSEVSWTNPGLGIYHRIGYKEIDIVDYDTKNYKANLALHFRTNPKLNHESPEFIISSSFGSGTTVYQGDNRFSLRDILFFQNRLEYRKNGKWFIRFFATNDDAGRSYDPYFAALKLQENAKSNRTWGLNYNAYWRANIVSKMHATGYPELYIDPDIGLTLDTLAALTWLDNNQDLLKDWHTESANVTNKQSDNNTVDFFEPGTDRFNEEFNKITSAKSNDEENGTLFYDKSALYNLQGEYIFETNAIDQITIGGNGRLYRPDSDGTIFSDTAGTTISNWEAGAYIGLNEAFYNKTLNASLTVRVDKNQNFNLISSSAASLVWTPKPNNYLRMSFSSAIRNPTLSDQYLNLDVGPATLSGNLEGVDSLITPESFEIYRNTLSKDSLVYFSLDPIKPEKVKTFEIGYRTTIADRVYLDASYYYSFYDDFLGYEIGVDLEFNNGIPDFQNIEIYRYSANSKNRVTTQGFTIGLNYYFWRFFQASGNYSWNRLNTKIEDPIIPAFNTPEHKFNLSISGRNIDIPIGQIKIRGFGFNVNYKWIEGFIFEGSPQFTGFVPTYDLLDAQINLNVRKINTTFKLGASNLLNNAQIQTYGGPRIGRLVYFSALYEFNKN